MTFDLDEEPKPWTIESLNDRLRFLQAGEVLRISGLPNEIYHGVIGVSCSKLKVFLECQYLYKATFIDKLVPFEYKNYFTFGDAGHTTILEPDKFDSRYAKMPDYSGTGSTAKRERFKLLAEKEGKKILSVDDWKAMPRLRAAIDMNPYAVALTSGGEAEVSFFKLDPDIGLLIKCRADYMKGNMPVDLKTAASVDPRFIPKKFSDLGYDIQEAMYCDIIGAPEMPFIAIQSSAPHIVTAPVRFDANKKRKAYLKYRMGLRGLKKCLETDAWDMYVKGAFTIKSTKYDLAELEKLEQQYYE